MMLLQITNPSVSIISFASDVTAQWSDTIPSRNVHLLVGIHLTLFPLMSLFIWYQRIPLYFLPFITFPLLRIPQPCDMLLQHPVQRSWACVITCITLPCPRWPHYQSHHQPSFMYWMYMWFTDPTITFPFLDGSPHCFLMIFSLFYFTDSPPRYPIALLSYLTHPDVAWLVLSHCTKQSSFLYLITCSFHTIQRRSFTARTKRKGFTPLRLSTPPRASLRPCIVSDHLLTGLITHARASDHLTASAHPSISTHLSIAAYFFMSPQPSTCPSAFMRCLQPHLWLLVRCRTHCCSSARSRAHPALCSLTVCLHFTLLNSFSISLGDQHLPPDRTLRAS